MSGLLVNTPVDITLPDWLQDCLKKSLSASNPESEEARRTCDTELICIAFRFAYELHQGQYRKSGEPYICHPVAVAGLLRDLGGSAAMIAAGFLHDVVEDTEVTIEEIEQRFGAEVRCLVEGVTKLSKINFKSKTEGQAENFRRMFLSMAKDIRVIVVKLADRLHNMRTMEVMSEESRRRNALETRDIFAPLANRLGIWRFKWELEDLAFKYLEPDAFREIQQHVAEKRVARVDRLKKVSDDLRSRLVEAGIQCTDISGRPKHLYSIYQKMQHQNKEFNEIYDLAALRIIVNTNEECYRALAVVHDAFRPIPGRFKDYIGLPKPNRYQSLHTGIISSWGKPLEVQIRTLEMHRIAEYGIAAHWKYKETGGSTGTITTSDEKFTWLRQLLEWQYDLKDAQEYLDSIKNNLFEDDIYVFTPKGDVIPLNPGSTSVDFAYRIHSEVGNHCAGARVNGKMVPLSTRLQNGDIVVIMTQKNSHPSLDWLNFVATSAAKNKIKQWYKRSRREENIARGRELLEKELGKSGLEGILKSEPMQTVAEKCNYQNPEDLVAALGYGEINLNLILNRWREIVKAQELKGQEQAVVVAITSLPPSTPKARDIVPPSSRISDSPIVGIEGMLYHLAGCCTPIPGEQITGVVTRGRGITIHRQGCGNLDSIDCDRLIPVRWNGAIEQNGRPQTYSINVQIEALDRVGVLKDILSRLSDQCINVRHASVKTATNQPALIDLGIEIRDKSQLEHLFIQIKKMSDILNIRRVGQDE
ncbi:RelA/SpoT family protein [Brunnivagina elsteri]|uniref:(P)ppGpp synthetase n=1 Tax=Brunnivagina elsteri CCALA 953 TaxID=987040 RepID=A0A2A2TEX9_9CYAN|nr:bifunctional (p)ppGpp synthetase/guanosine-3',5'-bis(diphosphate) 3'-pyrophosphohydrolase [Calothrix elsteri]PAX52273.1 (p)ppGpp synthetase [Calothrix elsteri CCALA 953]